MAFSWLELHKVNVTAVCGSVNVCVCACVRVSVLLQGAKLLQMSICRVHNPPEPTHTCTCASPSPSHNTKACNCTHVPIHTFTQAHAETCHSPKLQIFSTYLYSCAECGSCFSSIQTYLHSHSHLHKNIPPFLKLSP